MKKSELPCCPYCDKPLSYIVAFAEKNQGEYTCDSCNRAANIEFPKKLYILSWICELIAVIILILLFIFTESKTILSVFLVLVPFLVFYLLVPFFMKLKPCRQKNLNLRSPSSGIIFEKDDSKQTEDTIVIDKISKK